jgi:quinone-modifying oxidoreductase, subunit QmoC
MFSLISLQDSKKKKVGKTDWKVLKRIKYEYELDPDFGDSIAKIAYGEKLFGCIQCGTCSATCPVSHYMDLPPRKIISMVREGFKEEGLTSMTIWLCASCYSCTSDCPKGIKITDVMYALKRRAITDGVYPKRFPTPVLAREFFSLVEEYGRNSEGRLLVQMYLKTNPFAMLKQAFMGMKLFLVGRVSMKTERIKNREQLHTLLKALDRIEKEDKK